ncbi:MAG: hypothetical protein WKG01_08750 [Kofleriaceae bacterium]
MIGIARAFAFALVLVGCRQALGIPGQFDTPGCGDTGACYVVSGRVIGVERTSQPVAIDLGDLESMAPATDGAFTFEYGIKDHAPYLVTASPNCFVEHDQGVVEGSDVSDVEVYCDGLVSLDPLSFSAPLELDPAFRPSVLAYTARASLLTQQVALVARPTYDTGIVTSVSLGETPVTGSDGVYGPVPTASSSFFVTLDESSWGDHVYEVTLDPSELPAEFGYGKALASESREQFGAALASEGDVLVVGAPYAGDGGRVTVFRRSNRAFMLEAELRAPGSAPGDRFGAAVAIAGSVIVIGAPGSGTAKGAVYTSTRAAGSWSAVTALVPASSTAGDRLGTAVAIAGTTPVAGAPGTNGGVVHVFASTPRTLVSPEASPGDRFGASVAATATSIIVGAPGEDSSRGGIQTTLPLATDELYPDAGAVYLYSVAGELEAYLKPAVTGAGDQFGTSVATTAQLIAVGAPLADVTGPVTGGAYLFAHSTGWAQTALIPPPSPAATGDGFARSVALAGHVLVIGAPFEDSADERVLDTGAAHVYGLTPAGTLLGDALAMRASRADSGDFFGAALALTNDSLVVGAPLEDSPADGWNGPQGNGASDAGAVFAFR